MPFIWNENNFWDRYFSSMKYYLFVFIPLFLISMIFWYLFKGTAVSILQLMIISFTTGIAIYSFLGIIYVFPNANIPNHYHLNIKRLLYLVYCCVGIGITYFLIVRFKLL